MCYIIEIDFPIVYKFSLLFQFLFILFHFILKFFSIVFEYSKYFSIFPSFPIVFKVSPDFFLLQKFCNLMTLFSNAIFPIFTFAKGKYFLTTKPTYRFTTFIHKRMLLSRIHHYGLLRESLHFVRFNEK